MKVVVGGEEIVLGTTETAPTISIVDYSRRETDDFGVTRVVERGFARRMSVRLAVPFDDVDALQRRLAGLRATSALWVADDAFASLSMQGFYKDFALDLALPPTSYCTLTVEGLAETGSFIESGVDPAPDGQASTLQLLRPIVIGDTALTATNVPEADHPEWSEATTYGMGARVIKVATHSIFESAAAANLGNDPDELSGKWFYVGPTNRWAMFDQAVGTATQRAGSIVVTIDPSEAVNAVALLDISAATVRVQSAGYDRTLAPANTPGLVTFLDIPATEGPVTVTVAGPGTVSVGTLLLGTLMGLGVTEASPSAAITDFSRKETDDFGEVTVVERAWVKRMGVRALLDTAALDAVVGRVASVRARPCLWIGEDGRESLTIYGFLKDFSVEVAENISIASLAVEGLSTAARIAPIVTTIPASNVIYDDGTTAEENKPAEPDATNGMSPTERTAFDIITERTAQNEADIAAADAIVAGILTEVANLDDAIENIDVTVTSAGGNRAPNPEFAVDASGWIFGQSGSAHSGERDAAGDPWRVTNEHNLGLIHSSPTPTDYAYWRTELIAVGAGTWQEFSAWLANHRCVSHIIIRFYPASGGAAVDFYSTTTAIGSTGGPIIDNWERKVVKAEMPSAGTIELYFVKNGTTAPGATDSYGWMTRPQLVETVENAVSPVKYFPGSQAATVRTQQTAIVAVAGQAASLATTLAVAGADIEDIKTVANTQSGQLAQITTKINAGNPNLISNGSFERGDFTGWYSGYGAWDIAQGVNLWGNYAYLASAGSSGDKYYHLRHNMVPFNAGYRATFACSVDFNASGAGQAYLEVRFFNGGTVIGTYESVHVANPIGFNENAIRREQMKCTTGIAPAGTTGVDCTVVFFTPNGVNLLGGAFRQAKLEQGSEATPYSNEASVAQTFTALSTLNTQYASINTTVSVQGAAVTVIQSAINNVNGRLGAFWQVSGVAGSGRAQLSLYADANGGGGVDIIGDVAISGNLLVGESLTVGKLDRSTMTASTSGSASGNFGGSGTGSPLYVSGLGADMFIRSGGSIFLTFSGAISGTNVDSTGSYPSIEILNAADNSVLASLRLPIGGPPSGRIENYTIRTLNLWGDITIRWRVATRSNGSGFSIVSNPALSVYWTAL